MTKAASKIRFKAKLRRPAASAKVGSWTFLILPKNASAKLPSRSMTTVEGTLNGFPFRATLEPDGQKSHWLRVDRKLGEAAGADAGDVVTLEIAPVGDEPEPRVPADLSKALAAAPKARALWSAITPIARRDWIHWITSAKQPETRTRRIKNACSMLAAGKKRVCCFDRSGFYSKSGARAAGSAHWPPGDLNGQSRCL
ncbi:MAG: YdeI/OmpD-associated family protein [Chthoniobacterales bacterium]